VAWRAERIIKLVVVAAVAVVVALVLHRCYRHFRGIEVCLRNVDTQPLHSGEVAVRSSISTRSYSVGDLAPASTACIWVSTDNEASVDVTFTTSNGASKVIPLNGYIEPGYSGWISAEVSADGARDVKDDIDLY
jgi:hypothetical protein